MFINVYEFYVKECYGKLSKDQFIEEIEEIGYHLWHLNKTTNMSDKNITRSNVILSDDKKKTTTSSNY